MGRFTVIIKPEADRHLKQHKKSGNKAAIKKVETIIEELSQHPYSGTGQPEQLKYDLQGLWSRRINKKDRLIYEVNENIVTVSVISAIGHYSDK